MNHYLKTRAFGLALCVWALGSAASVWGQSYPQYAQFMFYRLALNPAYTGAHQYWNVSTLYRRQWTGFADGPRAFLAGAHGALGSQGRHGLGVVAGYEQAGPLGLGRLNANYALRIKWKTTRKNKPLTLALGLQAGAAQWALDPANAVLAHPEDPLFPNAVVSQVLPEVGTGVMFNSPGFYAGVSALNLTATRVSFTNGAGGYSTPRQYVLMVGGDIHTSKTNRVLTLCPNALVKYSDGGGLQADLNLNLLWAERFWVGGTWRVDESAGILVGLQPIEALRIGYAYEMGLSAWRTAHNGSHEVMLSYTFRPARTNVISPRFF